MFKNEKISKVRHSVSINLKILFLLNHNQYKCLGSCKEYYFSSSKNKIKVNNWYSKMKKKSKVRHFVSNKS